MYNTEIYEALKNIRDFGGIRSANQLLGLQRNKFYILNTDPSYMPGKHWVVVYTGETPEFFDSLGKRPEYYWKKFQHLLINGSKRRDNGYSYNSKRLQSKNSKVCGEYCIYYVWMRSSGYKMNDIVERFNNNLKYNDRIVRDFYVNM